MSYPDELHRELRALCRGRALRQAGLALRLGPLVCELSGVSRAEKDGDARRKVRTALAELTADLPDDLRTGAETALAFATTSADQLTQRARSYANGLHLSERTARRRIDEAIVLMARAATPYPEAGAQADRGPGWRVRSFAALLRLDRPAVELYETRVIMAEQAVREVTVELDLPPGPDAGDPALPLEIDAVFGSRITAVDRSADGRHYRVTAALPRRLEPAERHEFCLHYRVPPGQPIRDHYAIVPLSPVDDGRIRVRFAPDRPPAVVWRFAGIVPRQLDQASTAPGADRVETDGAGEVHLAVRGLRQGLGYGLAWQSWRGPRDAAP
jgi:hypothetical protein